MSDELHDAARDDMVQPGDQGLPPNVKRVRWDDTRISTTFSNVVNVLNTREEFMLLFGTNQTWNVQEADELVVALSNRLLLTPHAAKRMMMLLQSRIDDYEKRFGEVRL